ncbi:MAG: SDR family oxidoreductase [Chloroflexi bacterium]|nr:SDR family oxidoreductase [Chloroflexota bacterium]
MMTVYSPAMTDFDKVTIITGGSKGIGQGIARVFVRAGAPVVIGARGAEEGRALAVELTAQGPGACHFEQIDVAQPQDLKRLVDKTVALYGRIDCLVNNAGWHPDHRPIDDFSIEEFEQLLNLNLVSYFAACKFALPHLRQSRGSIINISSLVGLMGQEGATTYCATKGGITAFSKALAVHEGRHGVRVNTILPGVIGTPMHWNYVSTHPQPERFQGYVDSWQWLGRIGTLEEVGHACLFLASEGAAFITGAELIISGGAELAYGVKLAGAGLLNV